MEIRYTVAHACFGALFALVLAYWFRAPWWAYVLGAPAMAAVAYYFSLRRVRALDLNPDATFVDVIDAIKKRWKSTRLPR